MAARPGHGSYLAIGRPDFLLQDMQQEPGPRNPKFLPGGEPPTYSGRRQCRTCHWMSWLQLYDVAFMKRAGRHETTGKPQRGWAVAAAFPIRVVLSGAWLRRVSVHSVCLPALRFSHTRSERHLPSCAPQRRAQGESAGVGRTRNMHFPACRGASGYLGFGSKPPEASGGRLFRLFIEWHRPAMVWAMVLRWVMQRCAHLPRAPWRRATRHTVRIDPRHQQDSGLHSEANRSVQDGCQGLNPLCYLDLLGKSSA